MAKEVVLHQVARIVACIALSFLSIGAGYAAQQSAFVGPPALMALPQGRATWATTDRDVGEVDGELRLTSLAILLKRSPERQQAFDEFLRQQQDPTSPNFHRWLTPIEVGERFGAGPADIEAVKQWVTSQGLQVDLVSNSRARIWFSGTAAEVGSAFGSRMHFYAVGDEKRISIADAPRIPAGLSNIMQSVLGLETVHARSRHLGAMQPQISPEVGPDYTTCSGATCKHYISAADFATIYDVNPVYQQGINGLGQAIAIIGRANVYLPDIENFQIRMNLPVKDPVTIIPPNGIDPGPAQSTPPSDTKTLDDQREATLDVTRSNSVAPAATIKLVISAKATTVDGTVVAAEYVVDTNPTPAQVMSLSFGDCEQNGGAGVVSFYDNIFAQAVAEGISVLVSSGDSGAAGCDKAFEAPPASQSASINQICSSSFVTCVGGTQFADTANPSAYWTTTNSTSRESAISYLPEGAWNEPIDSKGNVQAAATGGGVSSYIPTPPWQVGLQPGNLGRYVPDVSFSASAHDSYFVCGAADSGSCVPDSTGSFFFQSSSGTSAAAPSMAGVAALLNEKMGSAQGNLNPRLYALASTPGSGAFHDVTPATSGVDACDPSVPSMCNNSTDGPTGPSGGLRGYAVAPGYDLATGLGSLDVANLLANWASATVPGQLQMPPPLTFDSQALGTQSSPQTATITNIGNSSVTISNVTVQDLTQFPALTTCFTTLPAGGRCTITVSFAPTATGFQSEYVTFTSNAVGSPQRFAVYGSGVTPNYQGLWWASPANSESGWGINFAHEGDTIFATWFTYDTAGNGNWLVMTAPKTAANTYSGTLYSTTGPPFNSVPFNPASVTAKAEGTGTLTFTDANDGTFSYVIGATSQTKPITREVFGTMPTCAPATGALTTATNYTDLWWASPAASESGWGINLTHEGTTIFGSWFTYDSTGKPMWLVVTAPQSAPNTYSGTLYRTTGPPFNSVPFNPSGVTPTAVGSATFTFANGNSAQFAYTVGSVSQTKTITREVFAATGTVCQ